MIKALNPGATREEILHASQLSDLVEVAARGACLSSVIRQIAKDESIKVLAEIIEDAFNQVLNFEENIRQLQECGWE